MAFTGLEIEPNDGLPHLICQLCRVRLEELQYFRKRCQAADRRLRNQKGDSAENNEDDLILRDVEKCTATACSESNACWRRDAAQLIRTELDEYKKKLLVVCKQEVREEIGQQVRSETEELLLAQARRECRVNVLDDLFYEMESFFVQKRNETVCQQAYSSEGFIAGSENAEREESARKDRNMDQSNLSATEFSVVELLDDDAQPTVIIAPETRTVAPAVPTPVPYAMVEINMQNDQLSHLREDLKSTNFLVAKSPTTLQPPKKPRVSKGPDTLYKEISHTCRKHTLRLSSGSTKDDQDCYRCRLRQKKSASE